jgi:hypothetical protein
MKDDTIGFTVNPPDIVTPENCIDYPLFKRRVLGIELKRIFILR